MPHLRVLACALFAALLPVGGRAQGVDSALPTLKLTTRLVNVSALVTGKAGEPAKGLTRDDFVLKQDGKPQQIRYFSEGSDLPLTLALLVDTSGSQRSFIADETAASRQFFPMMLKTLADRAVLVQFDTNVLRMHEMTNSVEALERGLDHLPEPHAPSYQNHGGGTLMFDAIVATSRSILGDEPGRRAMVLLTDGGDNGSNNTISQAVSEALLADIVIYSVYYSHVPAESASRDFRGLQILSNATGGKVFVVSRETPLDTVFQQIAEAMRLQYQLAYTPPESAPGVFHFVELKTKQKKWTVRARKGFFTPFAAPVK